MPIHVLPAKVASQIAAGEVVERPSSVVKELVENAIDAGADDIRVEVRRGGKTFIRVSDDGSGIPSEEVALAFERHSTSKLTEANDLRHIDTLGFRGEALASIAAVSRLTVVTRHEDESVGTLLRLEGGEMVSHQPSGRSPGTTITVENLFFNVPARREFLRTDRTERRHVDAWVTRYAIAYSDLRFTLSHDDREALRSPGNGNLRDVLVEIYGHEVGGELLRILPDASSTRPIQVSGFTSPPALHRSRRQDVTIFVNGRWIQDYRLTHAVIQAYHSLLPKGRYPIAVVMVDIAPEEVDVNVHPAKVEVRFRDTDAVFRAIQRAVRQTLVSETRVPSMGSRSSADGWGQREWRSPRPAPEPGVDRHPVQPALESEGGSGAMSPLRVLGQVSAAYIVAEGPEGLYLIDQHAAHERVLYERMMAEQAGADVPSQQLLEPATVEVSPEGVALVEESLGMLGKLGFDVEPFGGDTFLVRSLPAVLSHARPGDILLEVAGALESAESPVEEEVEREVVKRICKQAAVKAGQVLTREEMEGLIRALERCVTPQTCPHGRPTMIRLSVEQLAREFGRH